MGEIRCPHCDTSVDEHDSGRCLDEWVSHAVLNNYDQLTESAFHLMIPESAKMPHYSTDIAAAWEVVENFEDLLSIRGYQHEGRANYWTAVIGYDNFIGKGDTAPLAICRAALKAMGE